MTEQLTRNFNSIEFICKCGCGTYVPCIGLAKTLQAFRNFLSEQEGRDVPLISHCGLRCPAHNAAVGGKENSYHLPIHYMKHQGAWDGHTKKISNTKLRYYARKAVKLGILTGGVGYYTWGVHIDKGPSRKWGLII